MEEWERARDAKALEYMSDLESSCYDFMARDAWFRNGAKADLLKYRQESRKFKIVGVYEPEGETEAQEMIEALRDIADLLSSEGFRYEISTMRSDNIEHEDLCEVTGDYYLQTDIGDMVAYEIEGLFAATSLYDDLEPIECK